MSVMNAKFSVQLDPVQYTVVPVAVPEANPPADAFTHFVLVPVLESI
jgi:hypothetical protein